MGELTRRVVVTLGILLVFRLGSHIPIPGVDVELWTRFFAQDHAGPLGAANAMSGGAIARLSIFALGLVPYVSAAILIQVASVASATLRALPRRGEAGRRIIVRATLATALVLATVQGFGVASGLQQIDNLVTAPGAMFVFSTALTFAGGSLLLAWLAEQITRHGIGNGIAMILLTGIVVEIPRGVISVLEQNNLGLIPVEGVVGLALLAFCLILAIVFMERARLLLPLTFASRILGGRAIAEQTANLSLKINNAGTLPAAVSPWFFYLPLTFLVVFFGSQQPWLRAMIGRMQDGQIAHMVFSSVVIVVLVFVYTANTVDPDHIAERLKSYDGVIPGVEPGEPTAARIDEMVTRTTAVGAVYLALVYLIPELLAAYIKVPFYLGGASALIAVGAFMDIETQVRDLIAREKAGG